MSSSNDVNFLNVLEAELILNNSKVCYQKKEIEWTKSTIKTLEDNISEHKKSLSNFIAERGVILDEKAYIKTLHENDSNIDADHSDIEDETMPLEDDQNSVMPGVSLFNDNYEILKLTKPRKFYQEINNKLLKSEKNQFTHYKDQTFIPNNLKTNTLSRSMILYRIDSTGEYPLSNIMFQSIISPIDIHVSMGSGELLSLRGLEPNVQFHITTIKGPVSFSFLKCQVVSTRLVFLVNTAPMFIAIEINDEVQDIHPVCKKLLGNTFNIPKSTTKHQSSFLIRNLSLKDIRNRLIFMDAQFAKDIYGKMVTVSLTVMDYQGVFLINTTICPRTKIKDYCQITHGLGEENIVRTADSYKILSKFYNIIYDKIIVGHNLKDKFENLKVDIKCLFGVRELQGSLALKKLMNSSNESWELNEISFRILKQDLKNRKRFTEENTNVIKKVYIAVECHWQDTLSGGEDIAKELKPILKQGNIESKREVLTSGIVQMNTRGNEYQYNRKLNSNSREDIYSGHSNTINNESLYSESSKSINREGWYSKHTKPRNRETLLFERPTLVNKESIYCDRSNPTNVQRLCNKSQIPLDKESLLFERSNSFKIDDMYSERSHSTNKESLYSVRSSLIPKESLSSECSNPINRESLYCDRTRPIDREGLYSERSNPISRENLYADRANLFPTESLYSERSKPIDREGLYSEPSKPINRESLYSEGSKLIDREGLYPELLRPIDRERLHSEDSNPISRESLYADRSNQVPRESLYSERCNPINRESLYSEGSWPIDRESLCLERSRPIGREGLYAERSRPIARESLYLERSKPINRESFYADRLNQIPKENLYSEDLRPFDRESLFSEGPRPINRENLYSEGSRPIDRESLYSEGSRPIGREGLYSEGSRPIDRESLYSEGSRPIGREGLYSENPRPINRESLYSEGSRPIGREGLYSEGSRPINRESLYSEGSRPIDRESLYSEGSRPVDRESLLSQRTTAIDREKLYYGQSNPTNSEMSIFKSSSTSSTIRPELQMYGAVKKRKY